METTVNKWGNSLAIRLPAKLAKGFAEGTHVRIEQKGNSLILHPEPKQSPKIDDLVKLISKNNINIESAWSTEKPIGRELI